ncbi:hypothetical protein B0H66DRAFT_542249 [Apodospora peruviana]|uniref:Uncharacterized protein n=1 Tax=Apodospora peruviana TaxID=516989 RepID=A0AAE0IRB9_9PEZI|nr:hypothetical protein B0H66DRAFT_542249 [Apodospora peruviana]
MDVQLKDITVTGSIIVTSAMASSWSGRSSHVGFFIVPDMLRNAPMFRSHNARGRGVVPARGRATVSRARARGRGGETGESVSTSIRVGAIMFYYLAASSCTQLNQYIDYHQSKRLAYLLPCRRISL